MGERSHSSSGGLFEIWIALGYTHINIFSSISVVNVHKPYPDSYMTRLDVIIYQVFELTSKFIVVFCINSALQKVKHMSLHAAD
jgi:hypothetical protein